MQQTKPKYHLTRWLIRIVSVFLVLLLGLAGYLYLHLQGNITDLQRLDTDGALYYARYIGDYEHNPVVNRAMNLVRDLGCSAFLTQNESGEVLTCRNYDLAHRDAEGNVTGLNVVLRCDPEGKYSSINVADAAWLSAAKLPYAAGALDKGGLIQLPLALLPYLCMDGMNEAGLTASILALDVGEGETATHQSVEGKPEICITQLLRETLDCCATVEEAAALAEGYNMQGLLGYDYHLFVTDAQGKAVVMEWRYDTLTVTETDAVTNFYAAYDDAKDCYVDGLLKEEFQEPEERQREYHYGFGHGYARFAELTARLDASVVSLEPYKTVMSEQEAQDALAAVAQDFDGSVLTSFTQYSVIYNNTRRTMELWLMQDYETAYTWCID